MPSELFSLRMRTGRSSKCTPPVRYKDDFLGPIPQAAVGAASLGFLQLARYPLSLS